MTSITKPASSTVWMASILDFSQNDKKNLESILNKDPANNKTNPQEQINNEQAKPITILSNKNQVQHNSDTLSLINQFINPPLSIAIEEFDKLAHDEQNRLLRALLIKEKIINQEDKAIPPRELANGVIDYLDRYDYSKDKIAELAYLLLKPLGEYGSSNGESAPYARQQAVITNWLQYAIFGMPIDNWLLAQIKKFQPQQNSFIQAATITDKLQQIITAGLPLDNWRLMQTEQIKSAENFLLRHQDLKNEHYNHIQLTLPYAEIRDYYQEQILNRILPTLILQPKTADESQRLQKMAIDEPEWGYLHAGAGLLSESGADLDNMSLDEIIDIGMWLETSISKETVPASYVHYFKLPAMIHYVLTNSHQAGVAESDKKAMASVYHAYFDHLTQHHNNNNPFIQLSNLSQNWQSRPSLARQQLKENDIDESWLNNYLYKNSTVEYQNRQGETILLPNIDAVFEKQNQLLANFSKQTELALLPQIFNSLKEAEQRFIESAKIELVKAEFNARDSIRGVPLSASAWQGIMAAGALITPVPDSIDMLKCTFNGEERIYALQKEPNTKIGRYKLSRVDNNKNDILDLFPHDPAIRTDNEYQLKFHSASLLKKTAEKPQVLIDKLATLHRDKLVNKLQQEGYQETTRQKVDAFFLSLIPFYTVITEAQQGNTGKAVQAALWDIAGFLPFIGLTVHIGGRFSIATGEAALNGLQTALKQATFRQALSEGGKQLIKSGIPHVANSLPPNVVAKLSTAFLRSADPGFELLASGGIKGINALKKAASQSKIEISGLNKLRKALEKKASDFPVTPTEKIDIETAYRPDLAKEVSVINIGHERGNALYVQVNPATNEPFGRKYLRDAEGNLELAPVAIGERLYHLRTQGLGGLGSKMAERVWGEQDDVLEPLRKMSLNQLRKKLAQSQNGKGIYIYRKDLSNLDVSRIFNEKIEISSIAIDDCKLSEINLKNANLHRVSLTKSVLNKANLIEANLSRVSLVQTNLAEANLNKAVLDTVNLEWGFLDRANLTDASLKNINLKYAKLREADLTGVTMENVILINTDFTKANLSHASLKQVSILGANFSGAKLDNTVDTFTLKLPKWDETNLDLELNHFTNSRNSILTAIDSIDNQYSALKTKLALQLIDSLNRPTINLTHVRLQMLDILAKEPFIKNPAINQFVDKLMGDFLENNALQLLSKLETNPQITNIFIKYFDQKPELMVSAAFNSTFIQTILAARTKGTNEVKTAAQQLYKKYLDLPAIQQQLQHAEIQGIFGNYAGHADWADNQATNYLLLSPTKPGRVLLVAENDLYQMLHPNEETKWNNIFLFQDGKNLSPAEYSLQQCYKQEFPLFASPFSYNLNQYLFDNLIESLNLGNRLKPLFLNAQKSNTFAIKLVYDFDHQELSTIFSRVLDFEQGYILKNQNYNQIINLYNLTSSSNRKKAEHLFSLSTVFTRYSSSAIFGIEEDSPVMLRYYAYALLEKAHKLDPSLIGQNTFNDWKNRLLGQNGAFTCSAILADKMTIYANEHCKHTLQKIIPPAWR
ncbi:pentapeptide repeat-containing protein [Arsenophonus sp. aPb]|uniref:pentapeptide repeat-containing protein n=1 Tax=Arsenophonus sp. aPb TaxID=3041619 RepID=UPI002468DC4F|nr:pentapeptide repeat-containing protein [Arsenophonus sp. aPb]WGL97819.1 pentapeptide repeat-containing protein [Arsenophonus sp. aPb]